jgi:hypothetical protein
MITTSFNTHFTDYSSRSIDVSESRLNIIGGITGRYEVYPKFIFSANIPAPGKTIEDA